MVPANFKVLTDLINMETDYALFKRKKVRKIINLLRVI